MIKIKNHNIGAKENVINVSKEKDVFYESIRTYEFPIKGMIKDQSTLKR